MREQIGKLLCLFGFHRYEMRPTLANLDTYWLQGGEACLRCWHKRISFDEASAAATEAFHRGKEQSETAFLAYGKGVKKVVELYGKDHVQKMLDKMPNEVKK